MPLDPSDWQIGAQDREGGAFLTLLTAGIALATGVFLTSATLLLVRHLGLSLGTIPFLLS